MGCGCKQKPASSKTIVVNNADGSIQLTEVVKPEYTREEITRVFDYFISTNQTTDERKWVVDFHNKHFPEQLVPNCGECWIRLKQRMEHLERKLRTYEDWEKSNGETT
jgi:hypothetical protein